VVDEGGVQAETVAVVEDAVAGRAEVAAVTRGQRATSGPAMKPSRDIDM
jgi:hypothetical protein